MGRTPLQPTYVMRSRGTAKKPSTSRHRYQIMMFVRRATAGTSSTKRLLSSHAPALYDLMHPGIDKSVALQRFSILAAQRREKDGSCKLLHGQLEIANNKVAKMLLTEQDRPSQSLERLARNALALCSSQRADTMLQLHTIQAQRNMMIVLASKRQHENASDLGQQALDTLHRLLGPSHPKTVSLVRELSVIVLEGGDLDEAEPLLRAAERGCTTLFGEVHPDSLSARMLLGQVLAARGCLDEAKPLLATSLASARALYGDGAHITDCAASNLSALLMARNELWEAEALLTWHTRLISRLHGRHSEKAREVAARLAACKHAAGDESINIFTSKISPSIFGACDSSYPKHTPCKAHRRDRHAGDFGDQ